MESFTPPEQQSLLTLLAELQAARSTFTPFLCSKLLEVGNSERFLRGAPPHTPLGLCPRPRWGSAPDPGPPSCVTSLSCMWCRVPTSVGGALLILPYSLLAFRFSLDAPSCLASWTGPCRAPSTRTRATRLSSVVSRLILSLRTSLLIVSRGRVALSGLSRLSRSALSRLSSLSRLGNVTRSMTISPISRLSRAHSHC